MTGKVKKMVTEKGFGFITGDDGQEYFFHHSAAGAHRSDFDRYREGDAVIFEAEDAPKGPRAASVRKG